MGLFVGTNEPSKIFVGDTPISKVFLGDTQVRPAYRHYTPTSNTLVYYPFKEDINDYSGNNRNLSGTATFSDNKSTNSNGLTYSGAILNNSRTAFTISVWTTGAGSGFIYDRDSGGPQWYAGANGSSGNRNGNFIINNSRRRVGNQTPMGTSSDFILLTVTYNGSELLIYKNGVQFGRTAISGSLKGTATGFMVGGGTFGQIIIENRAWTTQEITDYYNNSKGNYGL